MAHSNAGLAAPTVRCRAEGARLVFMDAALPPESGPTALAPEGLRAHLSGLADEYASSHRGRDGGPGMTSPGSSPRTPSMTWTAIALACR